MAISHGFCICSSGTSLVQEHSDLTQVGPRSGQKAFTEVEAFFMQ